MATGLLTTIFVWRYFHQTACEYVPDKSGNSSFGEKHKLLFVALHGILTGVLWMASLGYWYLYWQPPTGSFNQAVTLQLKVLQTGQHSNQTGCKILAQVESKRLVDQVLGPKVQLYTRAGAPCPLAFHRYQAVVRIKPIAAPLNPGAFDAERAAVARVLVGKGTLLALTSKPVAVNSLHARTVRSLREHTPDLNISAWSLALLTGDRSLLTKEDWTLLQSTGTAHLFAISGMHLSLLFGVFYIISGCMLRVWLYCSGRYHLQPAHRHQAMLGAITGCVIFAALAGWQLPVTRALVLIVIASGLSMAGYRFSGVYLAVLMLFICVVGFPFSLYSAGFYLSVGAVCAIWFGLWRFRPVLITWRQKLLWAIRLQCLLTLLMLPVTIWFFGQFSLLTITVNIVMIPLITLLLPVGLGALLLLSVTDSAALLHLFDAVLLSVMATLEHLSHRLSPVAVTLSANAFVAWQLALMLALLPPFYWRRRSCFVMVCVALTQWLPASDEGWFLHVFDVGQGSALALSRGNQGLLIDTGPGGYADGLSAFDRYVSPVLDYWQITRVPRLYISHFDQDHAGGLASVSAAFSSLQIASLLDNCQQSAPIRWQGLTIRILWPPAGNKLDNNDHSCVLQISDGQWQVLIPGDIERYAEYQLLYSQTLSPVDILIAPHHGSKTSSGKAFIQAVSPQVVVFTQSYNNRWQFPHEPVVARYREQGAQLLSTGNHGYIRFAMRSHEMVTQTARQDFMPRWYRKPGA
ncbi:DNA internalization-related competence protein ComEC/Rec2 [Salinimonas lutimaris]|uniref:DNA internalization-related competence protein ComEC/Rec2 n=1 Tax=Salinimonas lutimaris TaxID=914153 RepID=UPI00158662AC|nr:DNA internalization-related competence protein ComEC/Rec2 [Salinimonas lutimaris]